MKQARAWRTTGWFAVLGLALAVSAAAAPFAIEAAAFVGPDGQVVSPGAIVVDGGLIKQVGGALPGDVPVVRYPGAVLSPGLVDCQTALGVLGGLGERASAFTPETRARDAFNRFSEQLRAALAAGVTTYALVPDDMNLVGGQVAVCQPSGPDGQPQVLSAAGPLKLSLTPDVFKVDREPTSRAGALGMLREKLDAAGQGADINGPFALFAAGKLAGVIAAPTAADVLAALELAETYRLRLVLVHTAEARRVAGLTDAHVAGVIVGPFDLETGPRDGAAAGLFAQQSVVAIAGGLPWTAPDSLRIGAAVAARAGLKPAAARQAITGVPAALLGVSEQLGSLAVGQRADIAIFSGDPLDLRSRVLAVYVGGKLAYSTVGEPERGFRP